MSEKLNILYASQTGTAEELAHDIHKMAESKNIQSSLFELDDISINKLLEIKKLMIVTSTTGDGEVPDNGSIFWTELSNQTQIKLNNLKYAVLALGDSSHYDFCNAGKIIDQKLTELGANCVLERLECDYDTEGSTEWSLKFFDIIQKI